MIITIDGPMASGKSTTARLVAQQLKFYHINSGLLYRSIAYILLTEKLMTLDQLAAITASQLRSLFDAKDLSYMWDTHGSSRLLYLHQDITAQLKTPMIDQGASIVSTNSMVRQCVNHYIQQLANQHNIVIDGRDGGSVLFPGAELKIFLTASPEIRAKRWFGGQQKQGKNLSFQMALDELQQRDSRDTQRSIAPLTIAQNAIVIDNGIKTVQEVVDMIVHMAQRLMS